MFIIINISYFFVNIRKHYTSPLFLFAVENKHLSFDKYKCPLVRQILPVCISQSVKPFHLLRVLDPVLRHIPHHLASGHLGIHAFLHDLRKIHRRRR